MRTEIKDRIEQIRRGEVPEGYKRGKLGVVPKEWIEARFSTLFSSTSDYTEDLQTYPLYSLTIEDGITAKTERYERSHLVKKENSYKIVRPNDYAYNPMNIRFGAVARHRGDIPVAVSGYYDIFTTTYESDLPFMDSFLTCDSMITYYNKVSTGSLVEKQRVHFSQFLDFTLPLPNVHERSKIAEILTTQEKVIELQQQKIEEIKKLKKAYLAKMFPKKGSNAPEIRFSGFTDAWEQRKLGAVADKVTEKNTQNLYSETFTNSAEFGVISQRDFFDHDISNANNIGGYYIVKAEDFVYNPRISVTAPCGPINCNRLGRNGVMSPLYTVFRTHDIDTVYLEWYFKSHYWHSYMYFNGDTGARSDRFSIKNEVFFQMPIPVPSVPEQRKIGNVLTDLDNLITLHQRKLGEMQKNKKALMQLLLTGIVRVKT